MTEKTKEVLLRILEVCRAAEAQASDPFQVDVAALFDQLRPLLPAITRPEELRIDAEAVWRLSHIVTGQGDWLHSRAALLYFDPVVTLLKIEAMGLDDLAETLSRAWRPVVEAEAVSPGQMAAGAAYWRGRPEAADRREPEGPMEAPEPGTMARADFEGLGLGSPEEFRRGLRGVHAELKARGAGDYFAFVRRSDFKETVRRAYLLAFLATHGLADIETDPIEERVTVRPVARPRKHGVGSTVVVGLDPGGPE